MRLRAGNEVRIQEVGDGRPVIFVHGAPVASSSWVLLADALREEFRCILVDRPGCGLSDPLPNRPRNHVPVPAMGGKVSQDDAQPARSADTSLTLELARAMTRASLSDKISVDTASVAWPAV